VPADELPALLPELEVALAGWHDEDRREPSVPAPLDDPLWTLIRAVSVTTPARLDSLARFPKLTALSVSGREKKWTAEMFLDLARSRLMAGILYLELNVPFSAAAFEAQG
jgi:hypothetical protein